MTPILRIGEFASPSRAEHLTAAVDGELDRVGRFWPDLTVERHRYRAPAHLLGHQLVIAEVHSEYRRNMEAAGCALPPEQAAGALGGELIERLAQIRFAPRDVRWTTERQLRATGHRVFDVRGYLGTPLFPNRWPFVAYTSDLELPWVTGRELHTAESVLVPAPLVANRWGPETAICEITTNGTAAAFSEPRAVDHAVRELAERDALRRAWLYRRPLTPVDPPAGWGSLCERDHRLGWCTRWFKVPTVLGPPAWAVLTHHRTEALFAIGSACDENHERGLAHALAEAVQGRLLAWLSRDRPPPVGVHDFADHLAYYCSPKRLATMTELLSGDNGYAVAAPTERRLPLDGAVVLTLLREPDAHAVKVFTTDLQPAEADHDAARLVGAAQTPSSVELNTRPHPFG